MSTVQPISARKTGELARLLEERLRGDSSFQLLIEHPDEVVALIDAIKEREAQVLQFVKSVTLSAIPLFDVGAHFMVTPEKERKHAELVIRWLGDNAQRLVKGSVEPEVAQAFLRIHSLTKASVDGSIIAELGGEEVILTTWGQMREMMRRQSRGQPGDLLTNGYANVFYIRQANGEVWAVRCYWYPDYGDWDVAAYPVTRPFEWYAGRRVVSR